MEPRGFEPLILSIGRKPLFFSVFLHIKTPLTPSNVVTIVVTVMASLRKHPKSPYWSACFSLPDGTRTTRSTKCEDRREAQRVANKFEDAAKAGASGRLTELQARRVISDIFVIANKDALASSSTKDFFTAWLKRKELEAGDRTHERYTTAINHALDCLGGKAKRDLSHLTAKDISDLRDSIAGSLSPNSANYTVKILRTALNQARRDGLVDTNEASRVTLIQRKSKSIRRPFTPAELKAIFAAADVEWRGMILMGLYTGLRLGDIAMMTWQEIDLQEREITIKTTKTGRIQVTPLTGPVLKYLSALPKVTDLAVPVFPDAHGVKVRNPHGGLLSNQFYKIMTAAGLVEKRTNKKREDGKGRSAARKLNALGFHCLRHSATSLLKNAGVSDAVAMDIIGHDSEAVSRTYTKIDRATKRDALEKIPNVFEV